MNRFIVLLFSALLILASCSQQKQEDIVQPEENEGTTQPSIIPSYSLSDDQYKIVLPYRPSAARGAITNQITNRVDIDELEEGLRRHSTDVFDPQKYVFEEGQYLETGYIYDLIDSLNPEIKEKESKKEQIEEHRENPRVFSHILEQNFLKQNDDNTVELVGISIGISLKSVYRFTVETGGSYYYEDIPMDEMLEEGKRIAEIVLNNARDIEGLENVPIMIALFREEKQSSPVPGNFVAKTVVGEGERSIGKWEKISEKHVLLSSSQSTGKYSEDYQKVKSFGEKISQYFPNYVGVIGEGFYIDDQLSSLTIEVPIEFYGRSEIVGFTQYAYGLVKEIFKNHYDLEVIISSSDKTESTIYRAAGEDEPNVHIFH